MISGRFTDSNIAPQTETPPTNGFLLFAVPAGSASPQTTMQWFYRAFTRKLQSRISRRRWGIYSR